MGFCQLRVRGIDRPSWRAALGPTDRPWHLQAEGACAPLPESLEGALQPWAPARHHRAGAQRSGRVLLTVRRSDQLRAWLSTVLRQLAPDFAGDISDATSLADDGMCLDSLALADLIEAIQRQLGIHLDEADVSPATFGTVGCLAGFLLERLPPEEEPSR